MAKSTLPGDSIFAGVKTKMQRLREEIESTRIRIHEVEGALRREISGREMAEAQAQDMASRVQLLEREHQATGAKFNALSDHLNSVVKKADELERERKLRENTSTAGESRISELEAQAKESAQVAMNADRRYEETSRRLRLAEQQVEESEKRATSAEQRIREIETQLRTVQAALRTRELNAEKAIERESRYVTQLKIIGDRLREAQRRAEEAEREAIRRQQEVVDIESKLDTEHSRYRALRGEMDRYVRELQSI